MTAITRASAIPEEDLPPLHLPADGPPAARIWADRDPVAAARLNRTRAALKVIADAHALPVENLLSPDTARRLAWAPPEPADEAAVTAFLQEHGARAWQVGLVAQALTAALAQPAPAS
jgi:ribonuclease D